MLVSYWIQCRVYTQASIDAGEHDRTCTAEEGDDSLKDLLIRARARYGICPRHANDATPWWDSNYAIEDDDYFRLGEQKYYSLHIMIAEINPKRAARINKMLRILYAD